MAVTKILARKGRLDVGVRYVLNGDKTEEQVLTASQGCSTEHAVSRMMKTKRHYRQMDGVQYYHLIQSFKPGEVTPELALEIAREFAAEHLSGYQAVIGVHVDKEHIHAHILFNSVNADTGEKYHSNAQSYYRQIRDISDRLCREHGLSVIVRGEPSKAVSYIEWLRRSKDQPTFRSMLEADLREAIQDANDLGHFFLQRWSTRAMRSATGTGWASACGDRNVFSFPAGKIHCSRRRASVPPSRGTCLPSKRGGGLPSCPGQSIDPTHPIPSTRAFWLSIFITSICWGRLGSGSIRLA